MAPLVRQMKSLFKRGIAFILNIGADPEDSEYIRLIKRIWYVSSVVALPTSLIVGLNEFMAGNKLMAAGFFFSFVIFLGFLVDGAPAESSWSGCSVPSMPSSSQKNGGRFTFFVIQRDRAYRLLGLEKDKSEKLLRRIENDLEQAARIQKNLLPKENPRLEGYDISGLNVPCYEAGGDYYDFVPIDADRLGIVIADVSGKGISASLLMASLRAALLTEVHPRYEITQMAARLNDFLFKSSGLSSFITFFYSELDRRSGELRYVNAGHNPPFVLSARGQLSALGSSGFPLGMFAQATYESGAVRLGPGDLVVLFTDGIPEGRNAQGEDFSEERLKSLVLNHRELSAAQLSQKIIGDFQSFATGTEPCDDITLVIIKRGGVHLLGAWE